MVCIFLKDVIEKVTKRGSLFGKVYYNIVIPKLSDDGYTLELFDKSKVSKSTNVDKTNDLIVHKETYKGAKYVIRSNFSENFDEESIKHSFHKTDIDIYNDNNEKIKIDIYVTNSDKGFK